MSSRSVFEAKAHLPEILDSVEQGEPVTICSHGEAIAELAPIRDDDERRRRAREAVAHLLQWRENNRGRFAGVSIRELIDEGRRY